MKGLTVLWMCLCCLRPEDVAKVLPQSGQACARAPTCCDRMCRCRLLGSVNTWDTDAVGRRPAPSPWPLDGSRGPLCPLPEPVLQRRPPGGAPEGCRGSPRVCSLHDNSQEDCGQGRRKAGAQRETVVLAWAQGGGLAPAGLPCLPRPASPRRGAQASRGLALVWGGHVTFTQFSHSKRLPLSWDIWWRMRLDFQLKALGHWSHLYSRSSVWTTMCCSKLCRGDRVTTGPVCHPLPGGGALDPAWPILSSGHSGQHTLLRGQGAPWHVYVHCLSGQASGMEGQRWPLE